MATALMLSANDALASQQHQNIISNEKHKQKEKVKEADGASFYSSPESSPVVKLPIPSSPQLDNKISATPVAPVRYTPVQVIKSTSPLRDNTTISSDPLDLLAEHYASLAVRPEYVPESDIEKKILQAQSRKTEELLETRRRERELALALEARIMEKENLLVQLQADMKRKVKHIDSKKDDLEQFRVDFAEQVKQSVPSSSTPQKSSRNRMQEEAEKKKLLAEWKSNNSEETLAQLRRSILKSQDDVTDLNLRIISIKKELELLHRMAVSSKSSYFIMTDLREQRRQNAMMGIPRPYAEAKQVQGPAGFVEPPAPIPRSHTTRMQEEKERKAEARIAARIAAKMAGSSNASSSSSSHDYPISASSSNYASSSKPISV